MDDSRKHGTLIKGSRCGAAKLDEKKVADILQRLKRGSPQGDLAKEYGVRRDTISMINRRLTWKHVQVPS
jgi:transcriptional regulator